MPKEKGKENDWWDGELLRQQADALRQQLNAEELFPPEHELEEALDKMVRIEMLRLADAPEQIIAEALKALDTMRKRRDLLKLLSPTSVEINKRREKFGAYYIKNRKLSPAEAERECVAGVIRDNPLLRAVRDSSDWLDESSAALARARKFVEQGKAANEVTVRNSLCDHINEEFSRAVSFAFYAGCSSGEMKGRLLRWDKFLKGNLKKDPLTPLRLLAIEARHRLRRKGLTSVSPAQILREILTDTAKVRKKEKAKGNGPHEHEYQLKSGKWKTLPDFKGFSSTASDWDKKRPDLGLIRKA